MKNQVETVNISGKKTLGGSFPDLLYVSPAPHVRRLDTVRTIMLDVIIALLPALVWGIITFGVRALIVVLISVISCVAFEAVYQIIVKKPVRITDLSSVVTGLMLGLMMPSGVSFWVPVVGSAFAIIIVKQFFGGLGKNIVNPAIAARVFLMLCWPSQMVRYVDDAGKLVSSATPLVTLKAGTTPTESVFNVIVGNTNGAIGEVSAIALCAGFIYLFFRRVVSWQIPATFIGTVMLISILAPITGETSATAYQLVAGSLFFAAFFAAGDPTTIPATRGGKLIFGAGCGLVTVFIRYFGAYPDGTAFAILLMNLLVPLFEAWTRPHRFGGSNEKKQ